MRRQKGFSLIELLIVVAIILIIAAIAIPNLIRARISANESSAAAATRTIATADIQYQTSYQSYATALSNLSQPSTGCPSGAPASTQACLIDYALGFAVVASPKSGYTFVAGADSTGQSFVEGGTASVPGRSGNKTFCSIEDGVVHYDTTSNAAATTTSSICIALSPIGN
jgi:type IV pilus assembly protein PilA